MAKVEITIHDKFKPFFTEPKRYNVCYGGRGKGATWNIARGLLVKSLAEKRRILCTREYQNSISESVYQTLQSQAERLGISDYFRFTKTGIETANGSEFLFKGLRHNIDSLKSLEGVTDCWVAEADKVPEESWQKLVPTIRRDGSVFYIDFNTDSIDDPVYARYVAREREDAQKLFLTYRDNPDFPEELLKEMEYDKKNDYDKYRWVWEGEPRSISDACIFHGKFRVDGFDTPQDAQFFHGLDFGFAHDPLAAIRCFIVGDKLYIDRETGGVGIEITETGRVLEAIPTFSNWESIADSARPELISHLKQHGFPRMRGAKKGKGSIEDGIAKVRGFSEVVIHERCRQTIQEFKLYQYKRNRTTGDITPIPEDKNNHYIDALRYALEPYGKSSKVSVSSISAGQIGV